MFRKYSNPEIFWVVWIVAICAAAITTTLLTDSLTFELGVPNGVGFAILYSCFAYRGLFSRKRKEIDSSFQGNDKATKEG